jgi:phosphopantothenoylcysteine decarboxylase / phosphopantothenate---cysteine ligase
MILNQNELSKIRSTHPSKDIKGKEGKEFLGKKIVLCITGSVAAYKAIDMARILIRHGADVYPVMSDSSKLITAEIMQWATGNKVVTKLTGDLEHIFLADKHRSDLILVYPCTANTLGKFANGIDDTTVTSVLAVALGSKIPIFVAPAMHESMYVSEIIRKNIDLLKSVGIKFLAPSLAEGKAKIVEPDQALLSILQELKWSRLSIPLKGKKILITAGSTVEHIDPIRVITNLSSGKMGYALAEEASCWGAQVSLISGRVSQPPPCPIDKKNLFNVSTTEEMKSAVISELSSKRFDIAIFCAAVTDFTPLQASTNKIMTEKGKILLHLSPTPKVIDQVRQYSKNIELFLVAFKAEYRVSNSYLIDRACHKMRQCGADMVIANDLGRKGCGAGSDQSEVFIVDKHMKVIHFSLQDKQLIARKILQRISQRFR